MRQLMTVLTVMLLAASAIAGRLRVFDDGDGTVTVQKDRTLNDDTVAPRRNEITFGTWEYRGVTHYKRLPLNYTNHLSIDASYRVATDEGITEASQKIKDVIAAKQAAEMEVFLATELPEAPELGAYSNVVIRVENMIDWFRKQGLDLQRPIKPTRATLLISEWIQAQEDAGNADLASRGQTYSVSLLSALLQFDEVGVTIEQVNAAYEYLKATGRYPDRWEVGP